MPGPAQDFFLDLSYAAHHGAERREKTYCRPLWPLIWHLTILSSCLSSACGLSEVRQFQQHCCSGTTIDQFLLNMFTLVMLWWCDVQYPVKAQMTVLRHLDTETTFA